MKKLIFLLALSAFSQQTGYKLNPFTGLLDLAGNGFTAPSGYSNTVTAQTTLTVTAATHGQGTAPVAFCFDNASPALAVACSYTVSSIGDVVFTWSPSFTGTVIIRGPGANAGAAGDVVGPSSSTSGCLPYFSGTSGKILAGDCSALFWDATNDRLGVGTGSPSVNLQSHGLFGVTAGAANYPTGLGGIYSHYTSNVGTITAVTSGTAGRQLNLAGYPLTFSSSQTALEIARFGTTGNLLIGTTTDSGGKVSIAGDVSSQPTTGAYGQLEIVGATNSAKRLALGYNTTGNVGFIQALINAASFSPLTLNSTGGNVLVGGTTDGNYRLDVQSSGSTGTLRVYDQTATTGNTKLVVKAGQGQSTNLTEWVNYAGSTVAYIASAGEGRFANVSSTAGDISVSNGSQFVTLSASKLYAPSNGVWTMWNAAQNDFSRLQFGGTTSSFPALKRSTTILQARLADDSAYTDVGLNAVIVNKAAPSASSDACSAGQLWAGDMGGTKYTFYCVASGTIVRSAFASF